jgi:hypothetical protein
MPGRPRRRALTAVRILADGARAIELRHDGAQLPFAPE